jgi:hypothetical protein
MPIWDVSPRGAGSHHPQRLGNHTDVEVRSLEPLSIHLTGRWLVVKVDDDSEVAFKAEKPKELKAYETNVECELKAEENAMQAGDRAYVFYDDQLLGTYTVA